MATPRKFTAEDIESFESIELEAPEELHVERGKTASGRMVYSSDYKQSIAVIAHFKDGSFAQYHALTPQRAAAVERNLLGEEVDNSQHGYVAFCKRIKEAKDAEVFLLQKVGSDNYSKKHAEIGSILARNLETDLNQGRGFFNKLKVHTKQVSGYDAVVCDANSGKVLLTSSLNARVVSDKAEPTISKGKKITPEINSEKPKNSTGSEMKEQPRSVSPPPHLRTTRFNRLGMFAPGLRQSHGIAPIDNPPQIPTGKLSKSGNTG